MELLWTKQSAPHRHRRLHCRCLLLLLLPTLCAGLSCRIHWWFLGNFTTSNRLSTVSPSSATKSSSASTMSNGSSMSDMATVAGDVSTLGWTQSRASDSETLVGSQSEMGKQSALSSPSVVAPLPAGKDPLPVARVPELPAGSGADRANSRSPRSVRRSEGGSDGGTLHRTSGNVKQVSR